MNDDRIQENKERVYEYENADFGSVFLANAERALKEHAYPDIAFLLEQISLADELLQSAINEQETLQRAIAEKNARIKELEGGI